MGSTKNVVVLGGGFAGLACATALAEAGVAVTVLEKKPHLGGRAFSFKDPRTGATVDNGQHLFMGCYRETRAFLKRIGSEHLLKFPFSIRIDYADVSGKRDALKCPSFLPAPLHLAWGVFGLSGLTLRDKAGLVKFDRWMRRHSREGGNPGLATLTPGQVLDRNISIGTCPKTPASAGVTSSLDQITVREWLNQLGQTYRTQERLFDPIAIGALNEKSETASAAGFVQVLREIFYRDVESSRLGLSSVGLSELYTGQAQKFIESKGGKVLCNQKIAEVLAEDRRPVGVKTERGETFPSDVVVSSLPPWALKSVQLPKPLQSSLEFWKATPIIGVNLWLKEPLIEQALFGLLGTKTHWVFNKTKIWDNPSLSGEGGREGGQYLSLVISGAHEHVHQSPQELFELACRDLSTCFPAFKKDSIDAWSVVKEPYATPMPVCGSDALRPGHRSPVANFYFAGDWTQTGLPATIESAVVSGHSCAKLILGGHND